MRVHKGSEHLLLECAVAAGGSHPIGHVGQASLHFGRSGRQEEVCLEAREWRGSHYRSDFCFYWIHLSTG